MDPEPNAEPSGGSGTGARIERILCPIDFSEVSVRASRYAQCVAGHYRATLVVQHVIELQERPCGFYSPSLQLFEKFRQRIIANRLHDLQELVKPSSGIQAECIAQEGVPADAILSLAHEREVSLIVLKTHGRRGFDRLMLGSVAERVLRYASCPVLAVRQSAPPSSPREAATDGAPIRRILCSVGFSAHSQRASEYALSAAASYDAEVTFLQVLDAAPGSAQIPQETTAAMEHLETLIRPGTRSSMKTRAAVRLGKAYREIQPLPQRRSRT